MCEFQDSWIIKKMQLCVGWFTLGYKMRHSIQLLLLTIKALNFLRLSRNIDADNCFFVLLQTVFVYILMSSVRNASWVTLDKNLDWKLICFNTAKTTNAAFLLINKKEGNIGWPSLTIHGASWHRLRPFVIADSVIFLKAEEWYNNMQKECSISQCASLHQFYNG